MSLIVLIHGAWGEASEFQHIKTSLEGTGHEVLVPDLPGHGKNQKNLFEVTLRAYVDDVKDLILAQNKKVILIGHSLAGSVISQVGEEIPEKIEKLIYVAAFLPKNGDVSIELMKGDAKGELLPKLIFAEDNSYVTLSRESIKELLLNDVEAGNLLEEMTTLLSVKQAVEPFMATLHLTKERFGSIKKTYVKATKDKVMSEDLQDLMIGNWPVEKVYKLNSGHFPLVSIPEQLIEVLNKESI
jgi:pimeloyl-ACP methyl ester carboxylesterase